MEGEPLRFFVQSRSRPFQHLVDLDDEGDQGCGCERSMINRETCYHIRLAIAHVRQAMGWSVEDWAYVETKIKEGKGVVGKSRVESYVTNEKDQYQDCPF